MKRKSFFFCTTMCMLLLGMSACQDLESDDNKIIIDPVLTFDFDQEGIPYLGTTTLTGELQQAIKSQLFGYAWQCQQTYEIRSNGTIDNVPYNEHVYDVGPISYYFASDTQVTSYYHDDKMIKDGYLTNQFTADMTTGTLSNGAPYGRDGGDFFIRILSIYQSSDGWRMDCFEPLYSTYNEIGLRQTCWGITHYKQMSDTQLKQMQQQYDCYFGIEID